MENKGDRNKSRCGCAKYAKASNSLSDNGNAGYWLLVVFTCVQDRKNVFFRYLSWPLVGYLTFEFALLH